MSSLSLLSHLHPTQGNVDTYIWDPEDHPEEQYGNTAELAQEEAAIMAHINRNHPASSSLTSIAAAAAAAQRASRSTHSGGVGVVPSSGSIISGDARTSIQAPPLAGGPGGEGALSRLLKLTAGGALGPQPQRSGSSLGEARQQLQLQERSWAAARGSVGASSGNGDSRTLPSLLGEARHHQPQQEHSWAAARGSVGASSGNGDSRTLSLMPSGSIAASSPMHSRERLPVVVQQGARPSPSSSRSQPHGLSGTSVPTAGSSGQQMYNHGRDMLQRLAAEMRREALATTTAAPAWAPADVPGYGGQTDGIHRAAARRVPPPCSGGDASEWEVTEEGTATASPDRCTAISNGAGSRVQRREVGCPNAPRQAREAQETAPRTRLNRCGPERY